MENKYNKITGFFANKSGRGFSVGVTPEIAETLSKIGPGCRIFLNGTDSDRPYLTYGEASPDYVPKVDTESTTETVTTKTVAAVTRKPGRVERF